ncbi:MAG TPA: hypothetical protein VN200_11920 [Rhodoglobus sp.]|nr:hypothetical protein [Rhodoglobus sp.]
MGDALEITGVAVDTAELIERADLLRELRAEVFEIRARLSSIDHLVSLGQLGAVGVPYDAARAESDLDQAVIVLVQLELAAQALAWGLDSVADAYDWVERMAGGLGRQLLGTVSASIGRIIPGLLLTYGTGAIAAGGGLILASRSIPGGFGGAIDRAMGSGRGDGLRVPAGVNEVFGHPLVVGTARELVNQAGVAGMGALQVPAGVAAALGAAGLGTPLAATALRSMGAPFETLRETPVRLTQTAALPTTTPPAGIAQRFQRIPDTDQTDGAQVVIERYEVPGEPDRFQVMVGATVTFSPHADDEPWDLTSNVAAVGGSDAGSLQAVRLAMHEAGIEPASPVQFTGFSQGGVVAARLAGSGEWNTQGVLAFGGPTGGVDLPTDVPVVLVEHTDDIVPALGGPQLNDEAVVVRREVFTGGMPMPTDKAMPAHHGEYYAETAALADADARLAETIASLDAFTAGTTAVTSTAYAFERVDGAELSGSAPSRRWDAPRSR